MKIETKPGSGAPPGRQEKIFHGLGVSPGIVIGPAYVVERGAVWVPEYLLPVSRVAAELARFTQAVEKSVAQLDALKMRVHKQKGPASEDLQALLEAHRRMLTGSRLIRGVEARITEHRLNAEAAVQAVTTEFMDQYSAIADSYLAGRVHDIQDVGNRLIRNLNKVEMQSFSNLPRGSIIIADDITPADTALMEPRRIGGIVSSLGGAQSHTAIMARSLGLPACLAATGIVTAADTGAILILDGGTGTVIINPAADTIAGYTDLRMQYRKERRQLYRQRKLSAVTRDGIAIALQANVELPLELETAKANGAEGIGLLRTEFMFMNRETVPDEEEQYQTLAAFVTGMEGRPVTIRTLDIGGDKISTALKHYLEEQNIPGADEEENPALGLRAIRLGLKCKPLLDTQLAAILRVASLGPVRILLPMIMSVDEIIQVRSAIDRAARGLARKGLPVPQPLPLLGAMIEVPAATLIGGSLARAVDFFSIGTNDLTQYTLAIDRGNEQVAELYDPTHPAVLRLIELTVSAAQKAGIEVNICGEMAGDERCVPYLLGLGIRDLSMSPGALSRVKRCIRGLDETGRRQALTALSPPS